MPKITDTPPQEVLTKLEKLRKSLDTQIPAKTLDRNLLIATWNIRAFGNLTEKWLTDDNDSPKRDLYAVRCIAEIISRFDVIAIQEVREDLKALRHTLKVLGPEWGLILTDVTRGDAGNSERLAFLFDTRRVQLSGLACELVVPKEQLAEIGPDALRQQFARTPYAVSFQSHGNTFILVTLHVLYGSKAADRVPELKAIATWLAEWAKGINSWHHNLIVLGDFNIDRQGDPLYDAFTSTGIAAPGDLNEVPRSIFDKADKGKFYDQIAWFTGNNGVPALSLDYVRGGSFDFVPVVYPTSGLTRQQISWRISDHYPLWAEFSVRD